MPKTRFVWIKKEKQKIVMHVVSCLSFITKAIFAFRFRYHFVWNLDWQYSKYSLNIADFTCEDERWKPVAWKRFNYQTTAIQFIHCIWMCEYFLFPFMDIFYMAVILVNIRWLDELTTIFIQSGIEKVPVDAWFSWKWRKLFRMMWVFVCVRAYFLF